MHENCQIGPGSMEFSSCYLIKLLPLYAANKRKPSLLYKRQPRDKCQSGTLPMDRSTSRFMWLKVILSDPLTAITEDTLDWVGLMCRFVVLHCVPHMNSLMPSLLSALTVYCHQALLASVALPVCQEANVDSSLLYLVCHRLRNEELASYRGREVQRGTPQTATNTSSTL